MSFASLTPMWASLNAYLIPATPYIALLACALFILCFVMLMLLRRRLKRLALGRNGSFEETIAILSRDMKDMREFRTELEKYLKYAEGRIQQSVRGVGLVRFNPFQEGTGGNQSFCAAFLDEAGSGVVLSTLYARDRVGVYAKPIQKGKSSYELTKEEQDAIAKAQAQIAEQTKKK